MTWKDSGNGKDPWQNRGNQPEDLDQMFEAWQKRLTGILEVMLVISRDQRV